MSAPRRSSTFHVSFAPTVRFWFAPTVCVLLVVTFSVLLLAVTTFMSFCA
jgi:hypothetical protein